MIPKEKAKELVEKFMQPIDELHKYPMCHDTAKQCALIAIDELSTEWDNEHGRTAKQNYWLKVKQEIEKL